MPSSVDPHAILAALGIVDADAVTPVLGGQDAALFRVEHGADTSALRVYAGGRERQCRFEIQVMQHGAASGLPIPTVRTSGIWNGRPALLMEWLPGRTVADAMNDDPSLAGPLGHAAGRMLAHIHATDPPRIVLERPWLGWFPTPEPLRQALVAIAGPPRLLHLDYHPLNLLTDGTAITGVLDWANAAAGDPRADLARTIAILRFAIGELPVDVQSALAVFEHSLLDGCGAAPATLTDLPLFLAWAGHCLLHDLASRLTAGQRAEIIAWTRECEREAGVR
ncbi:MAG: aminoglycoside phosphotransferase family protein [Thermomicrobiales bacterium]|nr:aminoglycoside phosphotransferase family protein [Thermomicrobiales bacterium]